MGERSSLADDLPYRKIAEFLGYNPYPRTHRKRFVRAEIELSFGNGHNDFPAHDLPLQMSQCSVAARVRFSAAAASDCLA